MRNQFEERQQRLLRQIAVKIPSNIHLAIRGTWRRLGRGQEAESVTA